MLTTTIKSGPYVIFLILVKAISTFYQKNLCQFSVTYSLIINLLLGQQVECETKR